MFRGLPCGNRYGNPVKSWGAVVSIRDDWATVFGD
jgi:hypothetical protein